MRTELPTISDTALESLNEAAIAVQSALISRTGEQYELVDLNEVLAKWLELSIEALCSDAVEHCVTGDRSYAFNRHDFERLLKSQPSVNVWEQQHQAVQEIADHQALAVERVA
ncbi:MAG: hypothetical protein NW224_16865 [Leptolyngbyaceae cyanobacterium bins.302]|nr:hypothetical protein [Leptolyngbyaceae cyanobacterium bins.302]